MSEYIIDDTNIKKTEITRCRNCFLREKEESNAYLVKCRFWDKLVAGNGFCYIGEKEEEHG